MKSILLQGHKANELALAIAEQHEVIFKAPITYDGAYFDFASMSTKVGAVIFLLNETNVGEFVHIASRASLDFIPEGFRKVYQTRPLLIGVLELKQTIPKIRNSITFKLKK